MEEKEAYGAHRAPERVPFEGRVVGSATHPLLEGENEKEGAYAGIDVRSVAVVRVEDYTLDSYAIP